ncbi:hypothetical protein AAGG74_18540 [Bacillus mexicanus]|uniref:hypothetical protein n=1 Tax=Bacillus mexicanus TaxID=2834415 RepID=UPI003D20E84A
MAKKKRKNKVEQQKKKILLASILNKWVCVKQIIDDEERYTYIKHRLRDENSHNRIEQTVLSPEPFECGVYYITDYDIDKILDWAENKEIIEIRPMRFDLEIGLFSEKEKITTYQELESYLLEKEYITSQDIKNFSDFRKKTPGTQEILLGYNNNKKTI